MAYSKKIKKILPLQKLQKNLYSLKKLPNAIPYVTSFYKNWGFSIEHHKREKLKSGNYKIIVDLEFYKRKDVLWRNSLVKGKLRKEILFSTYIRYPQMANNETSGPVLALLITISKKKKRRYIIELFLPQKQ